MDLYSPRKIMFKAWNKETKLLMRLNTIDCKKGELFKKDHILLQFTGLYDKQRDEVYEMDVLLMGMEKYLVLWDAERNGWMLTHLDRATSEPLLTHTLANAVRLCSFFEMEKK
ncbi:MAG: YopX family protein [Bacteroidota bacterium]